MIQIFRKSDGMPFLVKDDEEYDKELYTDIMPTYGLYQPIWFEDGEWKGTPYEEWLANRDFNDVPPYEPSKLEKTTAKVVLGLTKDESRIKKSEEINAKNTKELAEKEKRISTLEVQISRLILELTKERNVE